MPFEPPRLRTTESDAGRRATWLELFYDLVYVVVVAALAHELALTGNVLVFAALFVPVWWSWVGVTLYNDRFDTDDHGARLVTLLMMLGAAALAVSVHGALDGPAFALSYVFVRALLIVQYLRVARHVTVARPLCVRYATGFGIAAALWAASLLVPAPWRFAIWGVAMAIDIGTPLTARALQATLPLSTSHLPERIGLFTIIVLGEAVAAVVRGIDHLSAGAVAGGALGLAVAFSLWWVYFDNMDEHVVRRTRLAGQVWFYAHLPLVAGITATAVGVERLVAVPPGGALDAAARWLLAGAVAVALGALGVIHLTTSARAGTPRSGTRRAALRFGSALAVLVIALVAASWPPVAFGGALALVGALQVALDPRARPAVAAS